MSSLDVQITWATPVQATRLAAHLRAHLKLLPTIETLRLCNRYGTGDKAYITKLPTELLAQVETHLLEERRAAALQACERVYSCFTEQCDGYATHFGAKNLLDYYKDNRRGEGEPVQAGQTELTAKQYETLESWKVPGLRDEDKHNEFAQLWQNDVVEGWIAGEQNEVERLFGLRIHVKHPIAGPPFLRTDCACANDRIALYPGRLTVAHITLPGTTQIQQNLGLSYQYEQAIDSDNIMMQPITMPQPLTTAARAKFDRMMKILDLEPYASERHDAGYSHWWYCSDKDKEKAVQADDNTSESSYCGCRRK